MVRTIITPQNNTLSLSIPDDLIGRKVEVIFFAIDEASVTTEVSQPKLKPSQMRGFLSTTTAEVMQLHTQQSRDEWDTF